MIERACQIVEIPGGGLAALMPIPELSEQHWVVVKEHGQVLHANGHVHRHEMAPNVAMRPWIENWKTLGTREVVVVEPDADYDIGGGD